MAAGERGAKQGEESSSDLDPLPSPHSVCAFTKGTGSLRIRAGQNDRSGSARISFKVCSSGGTFSASAISSLRAKSSAQETR